MKKEVNQLNNKLGDIKRHAGDVHDPLLDPNKDMGAVEVDHIKTLGEMLKLIALVPMGAEFKEILRIRLTNDQKQSTMILMKLAQKHGIRWKVMLDLEQEALYRVTEYLKKISIDEAVSKFGSDRTVQKKLVEEIGKSPGILDPSGSKQEVSDGIED